MKKNNLIPVALCLFLLAGCTSGGDDKTTEPLPTETVEESIAPLSAQEQLTEEERGLFESLVKMTTADFYEPAAIRVLEIGDYTKYTEYDENTVRYGPDVVVVRLQGENRAGGTLNKYYLVCAAEAINDVGDQNLYVIFGTSIGVTGKLGDYVELSKNYTIEKDATDVFNIGRINKALKEYWEDMGF